MSTAEHEAQGSNPSILRLLSLLLLLFHGPASVRSIPIAELFGGNSSLCLKEVGSFDDLGHKFSICAFVRPQDVDDKEEGGTVLSFSHNETAWRASIVSSRLVLVAAQEDTGKTMTFSEPLKAGVWRHLCLYNGATDEVLLRMSGQEAEIEETKDTGNETQFDPSAPSRLCLGSSEFEYPAFRGVVTGFSVNPLSDEPADGNPAFPRDCTSPVPSDALLTLTPSWLATGKVNTSDFDPAVLCAESLSTVALQVWASQSEGLTRCHTLGGRLITESEAEASSTEGVASWGRLCNTSDDDLVSWLGEVHHDDEGDEESDHSVLQKRSSLHSEEADDGGTDSVCGVLLRNGSVTSFPCIKELKCSICRVPDGLRYTVYGAVSFVDHRYTLRTTPDGDIYFEGDDGYSSIQREGSDWVLQSDLHSKRWRLRGAPLPMGRRAWEFQGGMLSLAVTHCSAAQFPCSDGLCISRRNVCDGLHHCADDSDEMKCELIVKHDGYVRTSSPANGKSPPEVMYYYPFIFAVGDITTMEGKATFDITIIFKWKDPRISFRNLKQQTQYFGCSEVWHPTFLVISGYTQGILQNFDSYSDDCYVEANEDLSPRTPLRDPHNGEHYEGSEVDIYRRIGFLVTLPCHFQLQRYPFGAQMCNACIILNSGYEDFILRRMYPGDDIYEEGLRKTDLHEFKLLNVTEEIIPADTNSNTSKVVLTLHLKGLYEYHLLNSFAPSALMFFISFSSLFFPMENFNERIMVSLTALLVLATLFAQASNASVRTPYLKLLDVWYAAMIAFCFVVVVINVVVNSFMSKRRSSTVSPEYEEEKDFDPTTDLPAAIDRMTLKVGWAAAPKQDEIKKAKDARCGRAAVCNIASIMLLITLSVALIVVYILVASEMI